MIVRHRILQLGAARWLENLGYSVGIEVLIPLDEERRKYRVDVYGKSNGKQCVIEVGSTNVDKLNELLGVVDEVYVWPFSSNEPVKWLDTMQLCSACGSIFVDYQFCNEKDIRDLHRYGKWNFYNSNDGGNSRELAEGLGNQLYDGRDLRDTHVINGTRVRTRKKEANKHLQQICLLRGEGLTYRQIGKQVGLSYERVRQLLPKSLRG